MKKIFLFFLIVFLILGAVAFWYWEKNRFSKGNLKIEILAPKEFEVGKEEEYLIRIKNLGNVTLEKAELRFVYPKKFFSSSKKEQEIILVGDIYPGQEKVYKFSGRAFGEKDELLIAKAEVMYYLKNIKSSFLSETKATSKIEFVPLSLEFDLPLKIENGQEINFSINYFSNIDFPLENLRLKAFYPNGFTFKNASPQPLEKTDWDLPLLTKAQGGRVKVRGIVNGEEGEHMIFKAKLGIIKNNEFLVLKREVQTIEISPPTLFISQLINKKQLQTVLPGEMLHYEIFFRNIGKSVIRKKFMIVKLKGEAFDLDSLRTERGSFGRGDDTIFWDWKVLPTLKFLAPEEEGKVDFWIKVKDVPELDKIFRKNKKPVLETEVTIAGFKRNFRVKIKNIVDFTQKAFFEQEFWENKGSLPPEVGKPVQFTILWQIKNHWSKVSLAKIKAILPEDVKLTGKFFPEQESFTFDSESREVIWSIDEISPWQGFAEDSLPLTLAFQVEIIPKKEDFKKALVLIKEAEFSGKDEFSSEIIVQKAPSLDSSSLGDQDFPKEKGIVQ